MRRLRAEQRKWIRRRDQECDEVAASSPTTQAGRNWMGCLGDLTQKRIAELRGIAWRGRCVHALHYSPCGSFPPSPARPVSGLTPSEAREGASGRSLKTSICARAKGKRFTRRKFLSSIGRHMAPMPSQKRYDIQPFVIIARTIYPESCRQASLRKRLLFRMQSPHPWYSCPLEGA